MEKLKPGEKYYSVTIGGKNGLKLALFKNKFKRKPSDPDLTGQIPIAAWLNTKKEGGKNLPDEVGEEILLS